MTKTEPGGHPFILNLNPGPEFGTAKRFWQGCPTILRTPCGLLYAGWYSGGTGEPGPDNYNLLVRSKDDGWTWSEPLAVVPSDTSGGIGFASIDIQLWLDPLNRMWMFITRRHYCRGGRKSDPRHLELWAAVCNDPDAEQLHWEEPRFIANGFLRTQPTVLSNGDWVLCAYDWSSPNYRYSRSSDQGKTWIRCEGGKKLTTDYDETMILERRDHSLLMFARDRKPLMVQCTASTPEGTDWTDGEYTYLLNANSRFFLRRLDSGRILLINNNAAFPRTNLCARLSEDDGLSWPYTLVLDNSDNPGGNISYPDAVQAPDGRIFIIYDCGRMTFKEIRMAQITEEDIIAGCLKNWSSYRHRIISKAPGTPFDQALYEESCRKQQQWLAEIFEPLNKS